MIGKKELLEKEAEKIKNCKECKIGKIGKAVPGEGSPNAKIVFVGEAPGKQESKVGRPFIGRSGKFLRQLINQIGLREDDVYITSPVKYLPAHRSLGAGGPKRGTPSKSEIAHGATHLVKQLEIIKPKIIVLLGNVAYKALINQTAQINQYHGKVIKKDHRRYFPTFHPAAAIRFQKIKNLIIQDFSNLKFIIHKS